MPTLHPETKTPLLPDDPLLSSRSLSERDAVSEMEQRGFTEQFRIENDTFRALPSGRYFQPEDLEIVEFHRFEGKSNVEDMSIVYGLQSHDGVRGTLIDAFGPYAETRLAELLEHVPVRRPVQGEELTSR